MSNLVDKDTLAFFAVLTGKAQQIPLDKANDLNRKGREVLCFVVSGSQESALASLMGDPKQLDDVLQNVVANVSGLLKAKQQGRNNFSDAVRNSTYFKLALTGIAANTSNLDQAKQTLDAAKQQELALVTAEAQALATSNSVRKGRIEKLAKVYGKDAEEKEKLLDRMLEEERERQLRVAAEEKERLTNAKAAQADLEKALNELDQTT